jgi:hypothetical protein
MSEYIVIQDKDGNEDTFSVRSKDNDDSGDNDDSDNIAHANTNTHCLTSVNDDEVEDDQPDRHQYQNIMYNKLYGKNARVTTISFEPNGRVIEIDIGKDQ